MKLFRSILIDLLREGGGEGACRYWKRGLHNSTSMNSTPKRKNCSPCRIYKSTRSRSRKSPRSFSSRTTRSRGGTAGSSSMARTASTTSRAPAGRPRPPTRRSTSSSMRPSASSRPSCRRRRRAKSEFVYPRPRSGAACTSSTGRPRSRCWCTLGATR